jgi:hypothetical protein
VNTPAFFCFDNLNCNFITNVTENRTESVSVFPNPTTGKVYCNKELSDVRVYNLSGETVYTNQEKSKCIDLSQLNSGIYFIKTNVNGVEVNKNIIKQ